MPIHIEAYTVGGIVAGELSPPGHLKEFLEAGTELVVEDATWTPFDGSDPATGTERTVDIDDLVLAAGDEETPGPVHAAWHGLRLEAGPYLIEGELPTLPGFDPGRALTRPTGTFVVLREVRVSLLGSRESGENVHPVALVNRYSVDKVEAGLMLGFFFPGAHVDSTPAEAAAASIAPPPDAADAPPEADEPAPAAAQSAVSVAAAAPGDRYAMTPRKAVRAAGG
ncbi:MAG TPA: hypothetical protein VGC90_09500 [Candidatus Limnocylindrales bacterium]